MKNGDIFSGTPCTFHQNFVIVTLWFFDFYIENKMCRLMSGSYYCHLIMLKRDFKNNFFSRLVIAYDEENVTNILNSAPPCLKVIVTIKDIKPRLVEEATNLGLKIVR